MGIRKNKTFTLIELLVVVAIIGILAALIMPFVTKGSEKAKIAKAQAQVSAIKAALHNFEREYEGSDSYDDFVANFKANKPVEFSPEVEQILLAEEDVFNTRGIKFLKASLVKPFTRKDQDDAFYIVYSQGLVTKSNNPNKNANKNAFKNKTERPPISIPANTLNDKSEGMKVSAKFIVYTKAPDGSVAQIKSW